MLSTTQQCSRCLPLWNGIISSSRLQSPFIWDISQSPCLWGQRHFRRVWCFSTIRFWGGLSVGKASPWPIPDHDLLTFITQPWCCPQGLTCWCDSREAHVRILLPAGLLHVPCSTVIHFTTESPQRCSWSMTSQHHAARQHAARAGTLGSTSQF